MLCMRSQSRAWRGGGAVRKWQEIPPKGSFVLQKILPKFLELVRPRVPALQGCACVRCASAHALSVSVRVCICVPVCVCVCGAGHPTGPLPGRRERCSALTLVRLPFQEGWLRGLKGQLPPPLPDAYPPEPWNVT